MASTGKTAPFIVIDTDILSSGIPSNKIYPARVTLTFSVSLSLSLSSATYLHVFNRIDRDTSHPDIAFHSLMVGIVSAMRGQIKRDTQALLSSCKILAIKRVGFFSCTKSSILDTTQHNTSRSELTTHTRARARTGRQDDLTCLSDSPRSCSIHRSVRSSRVRIESWALRQIQVLPHGTNHTTYYTYYYDIRYTKSNRTTLMSSTVYNGLI